ncbi:unnamed protein product [Symbiodinium sp. CCMP2592]|nr:unnamed protein product [Symbiodinium sp. CCMP2592]
MASALLWLQLAYSLAGPIDEHGCGETSSLLQAKLGNAKHWVLADVGDTCDDACAARGRSCDPETTVGDISDAEFDQLVKDNHLTMDEKFSLFPNDVGPYTPTVQIMRGAVKRRYQV